MSAAITVIERPTVDRINEEHRLCQGAYGTALAHAIEAGRLLADVKAQLAHGEWLPWLEESFEGSERTARVYMQVAAAPELDRQSTADLSIAGALKQVQRPREPSMSDVMGRLRTIAAGDPDAPPGTVVERLDNARDRLRAGTSAWSEPLARKHARLLNEIDRLRTVTASAHNDELSEHAVAELLRQGHVLAREISSSLSELAFTFER